MSRLSLEGRAPGNRRGGGYWWFSHTTCSAVLGHHLNTTDVTVKTFFFTVGSLHAKSP